MFTIAIHGGAGTILPHELTRERERAYTEALREAIAAGETVLRRSGTALDAVEQAIISLENCPLFNAGRGAVFTHDGVHELDASLMCGATQLAGAVAGVRGVVNPISLARAVAEQTEHVLLAGAGAEAFGRSIGAAFAEAEYFYSQFRYDQFQQALRDDAIGLDHSIKLVSDEKKFGTVGAVALDKMGNLAAGTSTGGMTNKKWGRVGDSPLIGAGTFAENLTCAVSCTGHGEFFIKNVVAYDVACLMRYKGLSLLEAATQVVMDKLAPIGAEGGLIAVDAHGNIALPFNSAGMYRASLREGEAAKIAIFK